MDDPGSAANIRGLPQAVRTRVSVDTLRQSARRLRSRLPLILQGAFGAAAAWFIATDLLGHPMPFFAPVTAMICLGLTYGNRLRRVVELTVGVAIGVMVGDVFVHFFGVGVWQIAAVCVVAMSLAVLAGAGQLLMLQAGTQGVIVATLVSGDGQAFGRWIDAVVGGLVA
ncbi:MAG: FUSC family protein, partial [Ornithinimicrobium sp.]